MANVADNNSAGQISTQAEVTPGRTDATESKGLYDGSFREIEEGELVKGKVVAINSAEVVVDIGYKSEGLIDRAEFLNFKGELSVKAGDEVYVYLERKEGIDGEVILSHAKAEKIRTWEKVIEAFEKGILLDATVLRRVKGGLMVDLGGLEAFLPGSQVSLRNVSNLDQYLDRVFPIKVIKVNKRRSNVVVSRRALLEDEETHKRDDLFSTIEVGQIRKGVVKTITAYGAFVDLGGVDGLLHITDMSWGRISHPSQLIKTDLEIEVMVLSVDKEKAKISLGLKQRKQDPWIDVENRYKPGEIYQGTVSTTTEYGVFVLLEEGVEGLIHISEIAWGKKIKHPSEVVKPGDGISVKVISVDSKQKRISLSLRQAESDPWATVSDQYPVGAKLSGVVRGLANFGAFVEVAEGVEGLVHISDLTWSKKVKHPSEALKRGDTVEVVVLGSDPIQRRLSLGMKQLQADPWLSIHEKYRVGMETKAVVTNVTTFGIFAALDDEIEGLTPLSQVSLKPGKKIEDSIQIGDELIVKITKIQPHAHKIALSARLAEQEKDQAKPDQ